MLTWEQLLFWNMMVQKSNYFPENLWPVKQVNQPNGLSCGVVNHFEEQRLYQSSLEMNDSRWRYPLNILFQPAGKPWLCCLMTEQFCSCSDLSPIHRLIVSTTFASINFLWLSLTSFFSSNSFAFSLKQTAALLCLSIYSRLRFAISSSRLRWHEFIKAA